MFGKNSTASAHLGETVKEITLFVQNYPVLRKATSSSTGAPDVPGYVFEELIDLTFSSTASASHLTEYLCGQIVVPATTKSAQITTLRSLKCLWHVAQGGSRAFRKRLREKDEVLKRAATSGVIHDDITGSSMSTDIKKTAEDVRNYIFSEEVLTSDDSNEEEHRRKTQSKYGGMGNFSRGDDGNGRYEGFGSVSQRSEPLTDRMLNLLERTMSPSDKQAEVLKMCLTSSPGEYKPIEVDLDDTFQVKPVMTASTSSNRSSRAMKKHTPGKAGGGWEDSDSDEAVNNQKSVMKQSLLSSSSVSQDNSAQQSDDQQGDSPDLAEESRIFKDYVLRDCNPTLQEVRTTFHDLSERPLSNVVPLMVNEMTSENQECDTKLLRTLLLLEFFLRSNKIRRDILTGDLKESLTLLCSSKNIVIRIKAEKILLQMTALYY